MTTRIAIQQPYLFPYPGYFALSAKVDILVLLTNVQYIRRGWINRNRIPSTHLSSSQSASRDWDYLRIPVKQCSRGTSIENVKVSSHEDWKIKMLNILQAHYGKNGVRLADKWGLTSLLNTQSDYLLPYLKNTLTAILSMLDNENLTVVDSSRIPINTSGTERIIDICQYFNAKEYWNLPGGEKIYSQSDFKNHGIELKFIKQMECASSDLAQWSIIHAICSNQNSTLKRVLTELQ